MKRHDLEFYSYSFICGFEFKNLLKRGNRLMCHGKIKASPGYETGEEFLAIDVRALKSTILLELM